MADTIYNQWFFENIPTLPAIEPEDGQEMGVTLFNRAPVLGDDDSTDGWASVIELEELLESPHWQAPGFFQNSVLAQVPEAASAVIYTQDVGSRRHVRLVDESTGFEVTSTLAVTATPVIALAFWWKGTVLGKVNPVALMVRLDAPVLLQASEDHPATIKSLLLFSWSA